MLITTDDTYLIDQYEAAAIIGYWRSGADIYDIEKLTHAEAAIIKIIIENYSNRLTKNYESENVIS